jgi:hypothetical protein
MTLTVFPLPPGVHRDTCDRNREPEYEIRGLPKGQRAWLKFKNGSWLIRFGEGQSGAWTGAYPTADHAVAAIGRSFPGMRGQPHGSTPAARVSPHDTSTADWMGDERRRHPRRTVSLECDWAPEARIIDLSSIGCYVDHPATPALVVPVSITTILNRVPMTFRGIVAHVQHGRGFGVAFTELDSDTLEHLHVFLS